MVEGEGVPLENGPDLFARRAMDTLVGDTAFPVTKKEVLFDSET